VLVTDDLLGKFTDFKPKFVRRYASFAHTCHEAVTNYARDVMSQEFPNESESFEMDDEEEEVIKSLLVEQSAVGDIRTRLAHDPL
jgi:hypothetical protein